MTKVKTMALAWWHVLPRADTTVEASETLTVDVHSEGVIPAPPFMPGVPPMPETVVEPTVSARAQFTIRNDDFPPDWIRNPGCSFCR